MQYPGGKSGAGVYHKLIRLMPPHTLYAAPFLGNDAVMHFKRPAALNIGVDLNEEVIQFWRSRTGQSTAGARVIDLRGANTVNAGRNGKLAATARPEVKSPLAAAHGQSAAGGLGPVATAKTPSSAERGGLADRRRTAEAPGLATSGELTAPRFHFLRGDGITFLKSRLFDPTDLCYLDPPYLLGTRTSGRQYRHEFSDEQHEELLATIVELPCMVMISGYHSQMYASALKGWNSIHFEVVIHRAIHRTEWVWFNYEPPTELHDARFAAPNTRKTLDLKRKIDSWVWKWAHLNSLERQAILERLLAIGSDGESAVAVPRGVSAARR